MKILVYGWYENMNVGDDSYKLSLPILFKMITGFSGDFTFANELNDVLVLEHHIIVLGGGNILGGDFLDNLQKYAWKPIYALSVGCCDWKGDSQRYNIFKEIWVRDIRSFNFLRELNIKVNICPDAAFLLDFDRENGKKLIKSIFKNENAQLLKKKIAIILNAYLPKDGRSQLARDDFQFHTFCYDLAKSLDSANASVIFLPFGCKQPWDDRVPNGWVAMKCVYPQKNVVIYDRLGPQNTIDIISACDIVISTRLHSSIFALNSGVPFLDIIHNDKTKAFHETVNIGEKIDYWNFNFHEFILKLNSLIDTNDDYKNEYIKKSEQIKLLILKNANSSKKIQ